MSWRWFTLFSALGVMTVGASSASALVVRFATTLGNYDVRLYQSRTPLTVQNFLNYVTSDRWDGTFIHRAPDLNVGTNQNSIFEPFVVQGGGFKLAPAPQGLFGATHIATDPPVLNEPGLTNARGTIAMAKVGPPTGQPPDSTSINSATSEWFVNMRNNAGAPPALDSQNGGFTVFGRVVGNGMAVLDAIQALETINGAGFQDVPVLNVNKVLAQNNVFTEDVVTLSDVRVLNIPDGDYNFDGRVDAADLAVWRANVGSTTKAEADGNGDGRIDGLDFLVWQRTRGQNLGTPTATGVPEPASATGAAIGAALAACRWRRGVGECRRKASCA